MTSLRSNWLSFLTFVMAILIINQARTEGNCKLTFPSVENGQIISNGSDMIQLQFSLTPDCNISKDTLLLIVKHGEADYCLIIHNDGVCEQKPNERYRCPSNETGWNYLLEITPVAVNNGTWSWSSSPPVVTKDSMEIIITKPTSPKSPETTQQTVMTSESISVSWTTVGSGDERFYTALFSSVPGIIMMTVNAVIVVSFISLVVFVIRRKGRHRTRLAPQHDLALQEIQDRNQQQHHPPQAQPQQQQQRRLPEIPGQYQVPSSVPASSGLDARRSVGRGSHVYEVVKDDREGDAPEVLMIELPDTNLHPRPQAQEMTAAQAIKPGFGNGLYFHIHPTK